MPGIVENLPRGPLFDDLTRVQDGDTMSEGSGVSVLGPDGQPVDLARSGYDHFLK